MFRIPKTPFCDAARAGHVEGTFTTCLCKSEDVINVISVIA